MKCLCPVQCPEPQRLEGPQDGKAEPVEEWAGQSPPELALLGSQAPAVPGSVRDQEVLGDRWEHSGHHQAVLQNLECSCAS